MAATARAPAPPGPAGYPLVGVFPMARRDPLGFFRTCARRYGDVVALRLGLHDVYLVHHPDHLKQVFQDEAHAWVKAPSASRVRALFGESLTLVDGERWRRRRRQVQPAFGPTQHAHFAAVTTGATAEMLERWRRQAKRGEPVEVVSEMRRLSQAVIVRAVFGDVAPIELRAIAAALDVIVGRVERRLWSPLGWLGTSVPERATYRRALATVRSFIARKVGEARRAGARDGTLVAALRNSAAGREPLDDAELFHECSAFLFAGHTTTASALAWTWYMLSAHPDARERVEQECVAALGGRAPGVADLAALPYTGRVIDEVLRLYPPTWLTARTSLGESALGGHPIRPGAMLLLSPYLTHRHPSAWDDPERFDPDRFTPARAAHRHPFAYVPFGAGPRRCIGAAVAAMEIRAIVAHIAQCYRLDPVPGAGVHAAADLTLSPRPPLPMRLTPSRAT